MILRLVSMRHGIPFSIRPIVIGERLAFLASSDLLIRNDSRIFFKEFLLIFLTLITIDELVKSRIHHVLGFKL